MGKYGGDSILGDLTMIDPTAIQEIKQRADIVDIVSPYVMLKKSGGDYTGLCPFHDERSPSFRVYASTQRYYCFGCGAKGDGIKFLQDIEKKTFTEVMVDLSERYQVPIKDFTPEQKQKIQRDVEMRSQLLDVLDAASRFYQAELLKDGGRVAYTYLTSERGINNEAIKSFRLGYAPSEWSELYDHLVSRGYSVETMVTAGLIKPNTQGGYYDVFRDRLIIPVCDSQGRVIGFGAKALGNAEPKYLNSQETPVFSKRKVLFGLDKAKAGIATADQVVIVEGFFDAIALHSVGVTNVVAAMGTALTEEQIKIALRHTNSNRVVINFDADKAGTAATNRAIEAMGAVAYTNGADLSVLVIPEGKDADGYLRRHGVDGYRGLVTNALPWITWKIGCITRDRNLNNPSDYEVVSRELVALLKNISNPNLQSFYLSCCAEILSCGDSRLMPIRLSFLVKSLRANPVKLVSAKKSVETPRHIDPLAVAEKRLLMVYLHCPDVREHICNLLNTKNLEYYVDGNKFLWHWIIQAKDTPDLLFSLRSNSPDSRFGDIADLLYLSPSQEVEMKQGKEIADNAIAFMEKTAIDKLSSSLLDRWKQTGLQSDYEAFLQAKKGLGMMAG